MRNGIRVNKEHTQLREERRAKEQTEIFYAKLSFHIVFFKEFVIY